MRRTHVASFIIALLVIAGTPLLGAAQPLNVLVTNDDGYNAAGIVALVQKLATNPQLAITVIAPATNSSGTGDQRTTTQITTFDSTTGAFPSTAVGGFPADTVLFGLLEALPTKPDLVVSGINNGQNISDFVNVSGTVGAALWAARSGIPAFALSAGFGVTPNYADAADYAYNLVELFRTKRAFRKKMVERQPPYNGIVLNINFPTCPSGAVRGVKAVPVGFLTQVTGYQLLSDVGGVKTWQVLSTAGNIGTVDCASTLEDPTTDLQAFNVGFAAVTPLGAERTVSGAKVKAFRFAEKVPF